MLNVLIGLGFCFMSLLCDVALSDIGTNLRSRDSVLWSINQCVILCDFTVQAEKETL